MTSVWLETTSSSSNARWYLVFSGLSSSRPLNPSTWELPNPRARFQKKRFFSSENNRARILLCVPFRQRLLPIKQDQNAVLQVRYESNERIIFFPWGVPPTVEGRREQVQTVASDRRNGNQPGGLFHQVRRFKWVRRLPCVWSPWGREGLEIHLPDSFRWLKQNQKQSIGQVRSTPKEMVH